jgi:hypothetical protein
MSDRAVGIAPRIKEQIRGYTAGGMEPEVIEKILRGYFSGQRNGMRTYKFLEVQIQGNGGRFKAVGVDISRSGMLFRITDDRFAAEGRCHPLMPYTACVWHNFEGGFHIHFEGGAFTVPADIVRVTGYSGKKSSLILVACRFQRRLALGECDALGIASCDDALPSE